MRRENEDPTTAPDRDGGAARCGPYRLDALLGQGGMGSVWRATDTRDGSAWAVKLLRPVVGDDGAARFRREFKILSRLQHPNVLRVRDGGLEGDRPWYAMELIEGRDLRDVMPEWVNLDPEDRFGRIQAVIVQVARGLAWIHERGVVHRDISPANIRIGADGTVKIMDFGLVTDHTNDLTRAGELVGTMAYLAPEQIRGEKVDGRADLYALGTVLYQLLTGRRPFTAHTTQGWLERHLHEDPRPPREIDPLIPDLLDGICLRLLQKKPDDRFASAWHLLHALGDVDDTAVDERWPPRLVGRMPYRAWLRDALDEIGAGRKGAAALVTGEAGSGKTRLLDLADQWARRRGLTVVRGRCRPHDRPFGAFLPIYEALRSTGSSPILAAALEQDSNTRVERYPVLAAFRELIASRAPCVVLVDQLELADAATRELVDYLVRNTVELADEAVVMVLACEVRDGQRPTVLGGVRSVERVIAAPFAAGEVEELVLSIVRAGPAAQRLAERLYDETGGSPTLVADMLRGLVDEGVLRKDGARWRLELPPEEISSSRLPLPDSLREMLGEHVAPLPPAAREIGRYVALARSALTPEVVTAASGMDPAEALDALHALVDADIVDESIEGGEECFELSHVRYRDVLTQDVPAADLRRMHRRLGETLERKHRYAPLGVVEDLAWHFEQADLPPKACAYLAMTARKHLQRSLHDEALYYLDRAVRMEPEARPLMLLDDADRRLASLHLERARSLYHLGQWELALEAGEQANHVADLVRDPALCAEVITHHAEVLRNMSRVDDAEPLLERALNLADEAGEPALRVRPLYHLGAIRWGRNDLPGADARWNEALALARSAQDVPAEAQAYTGLGIMAFSRGQSADARKHFERSAELFDGLGMIDRVVIARVNLIEIYKLTGHLARASRLVERTLAQAKETRHLHGIALGLMWRARVLLTLGRLDEARRNAQEGLRLAEELGTQEEQVLGLRTIIQIQLAAGSARFAAPRVEHLVELLRQQDVEGVLPQVLAMQARCLAAQGKADAAAEILAGLGQVEGFPFIVVRILLEIAVGWREIGRPEAAIPALDRLIEVATEAGFKLYEMAAWQERAHHGDATAASRAQSLCRSITANLDRVDAEGFLRAGAGSGAALMPRIVDHDAQRDALALACFSLMAEEGYVAASMRRMAQACGVSPATFYHYFADKRALAQHMFRVVVARDVARVQADVSPETPLSERVHTVARFVRREQQHLLDVIRLALEVHRLEPSEDSRDEVRAAVATYRDAVAELLGLPTPAAARAAFSFLVGALVHAQLDPAALDLEAQVAQLLGSPSA